MISSVSVSADALRVILNLRLILNNVEELGLEQYLVDIIGFYPPPPLQDCRFEIGCRQ